MNSLGVRRLESYSFYSLWGSRRTRRWFWTFRFGRWRLWLSFRLNVLGYVERWRYPSALVLGSNDISHDKDSNPRRTPSDRREYGSDIWRRNCRDPRPFKVDVKVQSPASIHLRLHTTAEPLWAIACRSFSCFPATGLHFGGNVAKDLANFWRHHYADITFFQSSVISGGGDGFDVDGLGDFGGLVVFRLGHDDLRQVLRMAMQPLCLGAVDVVEFTRRAKRTKALSNDQSYSFCLSLSCWTTYNSFSGSLETGFTPICPDLVGLMALFSIDVIDGSFAAVTTMPDEASNKKKEIGRMMEQSYRLARIE